MNEEPTKPPVDISITLDDYHRWIGELYIQCCQWRKAAQFLDATRKQAPLVPKEEKHDDPVS